MRARTATPIFIARGCAEVSHRRMLWRNLAAMAIEEMILAGTSGDGVSRESH